MIALQELLVEIEKHAVLRGHAKLIAEARAELELFGELVGVARFIVNNQTNFIEFDPDGVKRATINQLSLALARMNGRDW